MKQFHEYCRQADLFKVFAHEKRLMVLDIIKEHPGITVKEIVKASEESQTEISHMLTRLRRLGIVTSVRRGRESLYSLNSKQLQEILNQAMKGMTNDESNMD